MIQCLFVALGVFIADAEPLVHDAEMRAIANRERLVSGELFVRTESANLGSPLQEAVWVESEIRFSDDRIRFDWKQSTQGPGEHAEAAFYERTIREPHRWIRYDAFESDVLRPVEIYTQIPATDFTYHPRVLGMSAEAVTMQSGYRLDWLVARRDRKWTKAVEVELDGRVVWKIEYERNDGLVCRLWIDADRDYCLVRAEIESMHMGELLRDASMIDLEQVSGEYWFPSRIKSTRSRGDLILSESTSTIDVRQFNQPIDEVFFQIAGLEPKPGTRVYENPPGESGSQMWDGEKLVPWARDAIRAVRPGVPDSGSSRGWLSIGMGGLALGLWSAYLVRRRIVANRST